MVYRPKRCSRRQGGGRRASTEPDGRRELIMPNTTLAGDYEVSVKGVGTSSAVLESEFRGKCILVTGGLGFIGSNLAMRLADLGANVLVVDSLIPEYGGCLVNVDGYSEKVRINIADVRDEHGMAY